MGETRDKTKMRTMMAVACIQRCRHVGAKKFTIPPQKQKTQTSLEPNQK